MEIRLVSSLEKPGAGPEPKKLGKGPLYVLQNETVSFQLAFRAGASEAGSAVHMTYQGISYEDAGYTRAECPDAEHMEAECAEAGRTRTERMGTECPKTEEAVEISEALGMRIRRVLPVMCRRSCNPDSVDEDYLFYDARKAPDLLRDMAPGEEIPVTEEWQSLWVDVCPKEGREAGDWRIGFALQETAIGKTLSVKALRVPKGTAGSGAPCSGTAECGTGNLEKSGSEMAESGTGNLEKSGSGTAECGIGNLEKSGTGTAEDGTVFGVIDESAEVGVDISVINKVLPKLSIPHTEWFHYDGIADYYEVEVFSEEFWRIFRNFLAVYVKRGGNTLLTPVITPPLDTEVGGERTTVQMVQVRIRDGEYELDFAPLERFLDISLEEGIRYFEICHLFTQWGANAAPKVVAEKEGRLQQIFGWDTPSSDPEYLRFLSVLLPALKGLLQRRGLLERTFFHISDEPDIHSEHYQASQGTVRKLLEGCTIIEAVTDYLYYEKGLVDVPVCAVNYLEPFLEKRPPRLWTYYCCAQTQEVPNRFISMPSWRNRIYGILLYWHRIDGILHWGFNFYNSQFSKRKIDPYETVDADGGFPAGDPFVVYPGKDGVPEESLRLMVLEEALNDYSALCLLESHVGRERVMALIRQEAGMELSFKQYPKNDEFILRLRERVNKLLAE